MTHQGLGEFEQMVLLAIARLEGEAYGVPIVEEIERRTGRSVARAAVYITLRRLEEKGFVSSWMSDPTPERGGKGRRCVSSRPRAYGRCGKRAGPPSACGRDSTRRR